MASFIQSSSIHSLTLIPKWLGETVIPVHFTLTWHLPKNNQTVTYREKGKESREAGASHASLPWAGPSPQVKQAPPHDFPATGRFYKGPTPASYLPHTGGRYKYSLVTLWPSVKFTILKGWKRKHSPGSKQIISTVSSWGHCLEWERIQKAPKIVPTTIPTSFPQEHEHEGISSEWKV